VSNIALSVGGIIDDKLAGGIFKNDVFTVAVLTDKISASIPSIALNVMICSFETQIGCGLSNVTSSCIFHFSETRTLTLKSPN